MYSILIDGCLNNLDVALIKNENIIFQVTKKLNKNLTNILVPTINDVFDKNKINLNDIEKIYIINGPGSFTSIKLISLLANTFKFISNHIQLFELNTLKWNLIFEDKGICLDAKTDSYFIYFNGFKKPYLISKNELFKSNIQSKIYHLNPDKIEIDLNQKWENNKTNFKLTDNIKPLYIKPAIYDKNKK